MMPGFADALTDQQMAALVGYLRRHFSDRPPWPDLPARPYTSSAHGPGGPLCSGRESDLAIRKEEGVASMRSRRLVARVLVVFAALGVVLAMYIGVFS